MINDEQKYCQIIEILGICGDEENLSIMDAWIAQSGLDAVYRKVMHIQSCTTKD